MPVQEKLHWTHTISLSTDLFRNLVKTVFHSLLDLILPCLSVAKVVKVFHNPGRINAGGLSPF